MVRKDIDSKFLPCSAAFGSVFLSFWDSVMNCLLSTCDLGIDWERGFVFSFWLTFYNQEKIIPVKLLPNITCKRTENMAHQQGLHLVMEAARRGPMQQGIKWNLPQ